MLAVGLPVALLGLALRGLAVRLVVGPAVALVVGLPQLGLTQGVLGEGFDAIAFMSPKAHWTTLFKQIEGRSKAILHGEDFDATALSTPFQACGQPC